MSTAITQPSGRYQRGAGEEYVVTCDKLELPRGSFFTVLPIPVERGDLALFDLEGHLFVGRWYPGAAGPHWIQLPGIRIELGDGLQWKIVGRVIAVEMEIQNITNLPESEYGRFLENLFPRFLDS